jgi:hypothetical protein
MLWVCASSAALAEEVAPKAMSIAELNMAATR